MPGPAAPAPIRMGYIDEVLDRWEGDAARMPAPADAFLHLGHWDVPPSTVEPSELPAAQRRLDEVLVGLAALEDGLTILDVGCGVGATLVGIRARHPGSRLVGVNRDARQLALARRNFGAGVNAPELLLADACAIPLPDAVADRVLVVEALFHFPSRRRFFAEAARLLRPGGLLVFSDFVPSDRLREGRIEDFPGAAVEALLEDGLGPVPDAYGAEGPVGALAAAAGFVARRVVDATANVMPSYDCLLWQGERRLASLDGLDRAVSMLQWLARRGLMRMEYHVYQRADGS